VAVAHFLPLIFALADIIVKSGNPNLIRRMELPA
jgi:hypothetical protein